MSSNVELFGDEDSSEDDSEADKKKETKPAEETTKDVEIMKDADEKKPEEEEAKKDDSGEQKKPEKDPFAEEDSDDDDSDAAAKKKTDSPKKDEAAKKDETAKKGDDDDDLEDSDEGDVEFDDANAVTGTGHSKGFQKKVSKKKSAVDRLREVEEAEEAAARGPPEDDLEVPKKPPPPKIDPRTMMVLKPDRPPSSTSLHVTKLPNLVGIQPEAFDPDQYSAKLEEEEYGGMVHDMIRWRYKRDGSGKMMRDDEGNLLRESNARLVQWEDGSYTLHVGKEALIVDNVDSSQTIGTVDVVTGKGAVQFAGLNGYLYLSQMAKYREEKKDDDDEMEEDDENVVVKDGFKITPAGTVLECMGAVGSRMTARPSSLKSDAHKSLTVAVRKKTIKRAQIAEIVTQYDPEKQKEERIKLSDQMAKEKNRRKAGDSYNRSRSRPRPGMNSRYLEDDGEYESTSLRNIKKRTMDYEDDYADGLDDYADEDDDDEETFNRKRPSKRSRKSVDSDEEDEEAPAAGGGGKKEEDDDDEEEEDDDEVITPVKSSKKRQQQHVFDDDDSDE